MSNRHDELLWFIANKARKEEGRRPDCCVLDGKWFIAACVDTYDDSPYLKIVPLRIAEAAMQKCLRADELIDAPCKHYGEDPSECAECEWCDDSGWCLFEAPDFWVFCEQLEEEENDAIPTQGHKA